MMKREIDDWNDDCDEEIDKKRYIAAKKAPDIENRGMRCVYRLVS